MRASLAVLAGGAALSRITSIVAALLLAARLGPEGFGDYSASVQWGAVLGFLVHGGVQAVAQREALADPGNAGAWLRASITVRLGISIVTFAVYAALVPFLPGDPQLLWLAGALVVTAAFDLKGLADAVGRTRLEVTLESVAGVFHLAVIGALVATDRITPVWVLGSFLAARVVYVAGVALNLRNLGPVRERPPLRSLLFASGGVLGVAFVAERVTLASSLLVVRWLAGPAAAGLYAAAEKIALAAGVPTTLVLRTLSPHLQHAVAHGDPRGTLERTLRAAAYVALPLAAGGWVVAGPLLGRMFGPDYMDAAWTLRWMLLAWAVASVGWRCAEVLFASRRVRAYVTPVFASITVNWTVTLLLVPTFGAAGSTFGSACAQFTGVPLAWAFLRKTLRFDTLRPILPGAATAAVTAAAAWAVPASWGAFAQVAGGAAAFAAALWAFELRRGWREIGRGIERASGFRGVPVPGEDA